MELAHVVSNVVSRHVIIMFGLTTVLLLVSQEVSIIFKRTNIQNCILLKTNFICTE